MTIRREHSRWFNRAHQHSGTPWGTIQRDCEMRLGGADSEAPLPACAGWGADGRCLL